ncbi:high frequency lysogenization protein Hfl D homolog [Striga asiatica]|uniref:High frequency lysogenization protein Hfl D homolog n=1 Tax=Striga asiatica TaxID=4170 RepID=A0A5A7QLB1_STRAF|nr:high frequency lysogenization protein Hfl D homolog [Striga asiatica]
MATMEEVFHCRWGPRSVCSEIIDTKNSTMAIDLWSVVNYITDRPLARPKRHQEQEQLAGFPDVPTRNPARAANVSQVLSARGPEVQPANSTQALQRPRPNSAAQSPCWAAQRRAHSPISWQLQRRFSLLLSCGGSGRIGPSAGAALGLSRGA